MPNRDKTGPEGKGPKTGRNAGSCGGNTPKRDGSGKGLGLRRNTRNQEDVTEEKN